MLYTQKMLFTKSLLVFLALCEWGLTLCLPMITTGFVYKLESKWLITKIYLFHCHVLYAIFIVIVRFAEFHSLSNKVAYIALSWLTSLVYMQDYMKEQQLPSALKHRVLDFFEYLWVRNKGTDRQSLLSDMPYCMQAEVSLATTESLLRKVLLYNYSFCYACIPIPGQSTTLYIHGYQLELFSSQNRRNLSQQYGSY